MSNTLLEEKDYKNIIGLIESIPKTYTSTVKHGYSLISRLYECAVQSGLPGFSKFSKDYTLLQKMVEGSETIDWNAPANNYSILPPLDLKDIKHDVARLTYGYVLDFRELKVLHKYLLNNKGFNFFEAVEQGYMKDLTGNIQPHVLNLFTNCLNSGLIEMNDFNKPLFKRLIEYNCSRGDKYLAQDVLEVFTKMMVKNKEATYIENDWLIEHINTFFNSQKTVNKATVKKLEKFLNEFQQLDISGHTISPYLTKYLDNSTAIKERTPQAYNWEVDLNHLSLTEDISIKLLKNNLDEVIKVLMAEKYKLPGVINLHTARSKNIISLFVVYDEDTSLPDIKKFLSLSVDMTKEKKTFNNDLCKEMWSSLKLHNVLSGSLTERTHSPKAKKI